MKFIQRNLMKASFFLLQWIPYVVLAQNDLGGMDEISGSDVTVSEAGIRNKILSILLRILSFVGLIAVIMIVVAGIYLVASNGDEENKEKAKKIIIYVIVGIIVIALASALVAFVITVFGG